jgi:hypothetical protein
MTVTLLQLHAYEMCSHVTKEYKNRGKEKEKHKNIKRWDEQ